MRILPLACVVPLLAGCTAAGYRTEACRPAAPAPCPTGVVFVANGSGDFRSTSNNLSQIVADNGVPLHVETFVWSHGYRRYLVDHLDHANHLDEGRRLAAQIAAYRRTYPDRKVYLIGHSAGSAVVLAAAELLPPDDLERIVLQAPSVCVSYDLRPALRAARRGIDVYYSEQDRVILGLGVGIVGTADRACHTAAGQYGFRPDVVCPADAALYAKLRQHPWDPAVAWSGNNGGHYGSTHAGFLKAYVLPLLVEESGH